MATTVAAGRRRSVQLHPLHAALLAGALPLFLGALLSDWAYGASYEVQWANFASWLIAGALVFSGFALLWSLVSLLRSGRRREQFVPFLLLLVTWLLGFGNALVHAKDGWAMMPEGLVLSVVVTILTIASIWVAFSDRHSGVRS